MGGRHLPYDVIGTISASTKKVRASVLGDIVKVIGHTIEGCWNAYVVILKHYW